MKFHTAWLFTVVAALAGCNDREFSNSSKPVLYGCNSSQGPSPLIAYQWYLSNNQSEQSNAFSKGGVNKGNDVNALEAHALVTGAGITVNVIDTGLELNHEDLCTNQSASYDYLENDTNPQPLRTDFDHGTAVAGIIGMKDNGVGGKGVAPGVTLIGHAFIERSRGISTTQFAGALGVSYGDNPSATEIAQVYNQSFGVGQEDGGSYRDSHTNPVILDWDIYTQGIAKGRGGKGYVYVKAAGNGFIDGGADSEGVDSCGTNPHGCANASFDYTAAHPANIVVAATNAAGRRASYSTVGSGVWVSAPGGESGYTTDLWPSDDPNNARYLSPAFVTTDVQRCSRGASQFYSFDDETSTPANLFEYTRNGPHALNQLCNYTSTMNGTSSAAPVVSGIAALMLEANPDLTWRDVKHILASTATRIDPGNTDGNLNGVLAKNGWTTNAAGKKFHTWYGFGQVDAFAAVRWAKNYTANTFGAWQDIDVTGTADLPIADYDGDTGAVAATQSIEFADDLVIEATRLTLSICGPLSNPANDQPSDYTIHLISPGDTTSVLKSGKEYMADRTTYACGLHNVAFLTNAFYAESSKGTWQVKIYDIAAGNTGRLTDYTLEIFGHTP